MKIRIEIIDNSSEDEVIIRCREVNSHIQKIQKMLMAEAPQPLGLTFFKDDKEYYFPLQNIIFFETAGDTVYAHTAADAFRIKFRLYELEKLLPAAFVRISKSNIVNTKHILAISRNLTSSSLIQFYKSHKQVYVSRHYYKALREQLEKSQL